MDIKDGLAKALRQYRHNNGDGFVFGYDKETIDNLVTELQEKLQGYIFALDAEKAHVERLQEQQKWHRIDEKTPDKDGQYITYHGELGGHAMNNWESQFQDFEWYTKSITHWKEIDKPEDV